MSDSRISDASQRAMALQPDRSFIVQAPAGSGKTELLTQRYLRLLTTVEHPEEIYAITFTRKAASEMRNRILSALDAAHESCPAEAHRRQTWQLAQAVNLHAQQHNWQLRSNPNRLRIQTFDSLAHALTRQMPLIAELGAPPGTRENCTPLYREAARVTLGMLEDPDIGPALQTLLSHLGNQLAHLEELLSRMLARRDQWLKHVVSSPDTGQLDQSLRDSIETQLRHLDDHMPASMMTELISSAGFAADNLKDNVKYSGHITAWTEQKFPPGPSWEDLPLWLGLAELLLTRGGTRRKSINASSGFPAPGSAAKDPDRKQLLQARKTEVLQLAVQLDEQPALTRLLAGLRSLPVHGYSAQQAELLQSLIQVLVHAVGQLQLVFQDKGEVDFSEIQIRARQALGDEDQPTDLALALDYRIKHLLIDEFQDTSNSQYDLLRTLTGGWQANDGRTLFAVGDPMQSIYRFREAEVGLYLKAREQGLGNLPLQPLTLEVNFRSTQGIIDWVNGSFAQIFPPEVDSSSGAVCYSPSRALDQQAEDNAVQVHALAGRDDDAEAGQVVALIQQTLANSPSSDIAVLARGRSHLFQIAAMLNAVGLHFQAVDVDALASRPVVSDLHALTRALLHPADRLSWLALLRSPVLGLQLADLLCIAEPSALPIYQRLCDPDVQRQLSDDGHTRVSRLLSVIRDELPMRGRRPLNQLVEGCWLALGGLSARPHTQADAEAYLQLLAEHEQPGGLYDFAALNEALDRLYAPSNSEADGRIQLMTMHKSKGLEFDTVILPGLGRRPRGNDAELLYWLEQPGSAGDMQLLMAPIKAVEQDQEPIANFIRELNKHKDDLETVRLLYVAATRAKRRLHLLGHISFNQEGQPRKPEAGSLLKCLWPVVEHHFQELSEAADKSTLQQPGTPARLQRLPANWQPQPLTTQVDTIPMPVQEDSPAINFDWAGDNARHIGTLVHRYLERIAKEGLPRWNEERLQKLAPALRCALANLGVDADALDNAVARTTHALTNTLEDETGCWILENHQDAACELALTVHDDDIRHYIIDRTFIDAEGTRWIIDYKTGDHQGKDVEAFLDEEQKRYQAQLENYACIMSQQEHRPTRLALYFPLLQDWRVWEKAVTQQTFEDA